MLVFAICLAQGFVGLGGKVGGPLGQGRFGLGRALEEGEVRGLGSVVEVVLLEEILWWQKSREV